MFRIKLKSTLFFIILQCCILQIQESAGNTKKKFTGPEQNKVGGVITPNDFKGTDTELIQ